MVAPQRAKKMSKGQFESVSLHSVRTSRSNDRVFIDEEEASECNSTYNECPDGSEMSGDSGEYANIPPVDTGRRRQDDVEANTAYVDLNQLDEQQMAMFIRGMGYEKKSVIPPPTTICNLLIGAVLGISLFVLMINFFGSPANCFGRGGGRLAEATSTESPMRHIRRRRSLPPSTICSECDLTELIAELESLRRETGVTVGSVRDRLRELCNDSPPPYRPTALPEVDETVFFSANSTVVPQEDTTIVASPDSTNMSVENDDSDSVNSTEIDASTLKAPSVEELPTFPEANNTAISVNTTFAMEIPSNATVDNITIVDNITETTPPAPTFYEY